jgi:hypothetical protein
VIFVVHIKRERLLNNFIKPVVWEKRFICLLLYFLSAAVNAQSSEQPLSDQQPSDSGAVIKTAEQDSVQDLEPSSETVPGEHTGESSDDKTPDTAYEVEDTERYQIYRREHPVNPCERSLDTYDYELSWYDSSQVYVNSKFCEPALWFDNFFASDRIFAEGVAGTYIRWRNEFTFDEEEPFKFKTAISASVELPGTESRLRITFDGDEDEALRDIAPGNDQNDTNTLGLQLDLRQNARSKFNVSVSLSPKIKFRYRYTYPVLETLILRFTQEVERKKQINSARSLFDVEHFFAEKFLFRSSTEGRLSEEFEGVDWLQAFVVYQRLNQKTSLSYEASVNGITEPSTLALNYRLGFRIRKNFHREWLFFEIAPEMTWPVSLDEDRAEVLIERRSKWLLFFRLEVHFGNAHKKRYQDYN